MTVGAFELTPPPVGKRRDRDFYPTVPAATRVLLSRVRIAGVVVEPCVGAGDIASVLAGPLRCVVTNDIDRSRPADFHRDATSPSAWRVFEREGQIDWVVTNPPFNRAEAIVPLAYEHARKGVAMLLRLSYLEPCGERAEWLAEHPPTAALVLPRISFTGDGKTDSTTCAWFVWEKPHQRQRIEIITKRAMAAVQTA